MSYIANRGEQSTSTEIEALANLAALGASATGEFLRKTGATTFENALAGGVETPLGLVNQSNLDYTVTNNPAYIVVDKGLLFEGAGYSYNSSTKTIHIETGMAPNEFIRSFYRTAVASVETNRVMTVGVNFDGGGAALSAGTTRYVRVPYGCTINSATMLADLVGSAVVDVWLDTFNNYPPTISDSITGASPVTLSASNKSENTTLSGWNLSIPAGSVLGFRLISASDIAWLWVGLKVTKT